MMMTTMGTALFVTTMTTTFVIGTVGWCWMLRRGRSTKNTKNNKKISTGDEPSTLSSSSANKTKTAPVLKNVWDAPRNNVTTGMLPLDDDDDDDNKKNADNPTKKTRKFASSYYYAHNNPKAIGGYKDGLRLEDYTMNQPRLLSVKKSSTSSTSTSTLTPGGEGGGQQRQQPICSSMRPDDSTMTSVPDMDMNDNNENNHNNHNSSSHETKKKKPIRIISHYLWDDPGDPDKGIATLRIDSFPHWKDSTQRVPCQDLTILHAHAELLSLTEDRGEDTQEEEERHRHESTTTTQSPPQQQGLKIKIESVEAYYELFLPALYGPVTTVKTIVKAHKVLIKLTKTKTITATPPPTTTGFFLFSSSPKTKDKNLEVWPEPGRKVIV
jgi:hypothetical protein